MSGMDSVEVLVIQQVPDQVLDRIANVDSRVELENVIDWQRGY
jgi:hypothetical protein